VRKPSILAVAIAVLVLASAPLHSFTMEPMSTLLLPSGTGSVATFRIKNDGDARIAIRISVLTRSQTIEGKEINSPAETLFSVYPARLVIEPGAVSAVKIQWRGASDLAREQCFRFVAEEVALSSQAAQSTGIRVLFRYIASLYVGSEAFSPEISASAVAAKNPAGEAGFFVEIENRGSRHVIALDAVLSLSDESGRVITIGSEELDTLNAANYLPGSKRRLFIRREEAVPGRLYDARITYEGEY